MKKFIRIFTRILNSPLALALWGVLALTVPNIVLDITEPYPPMWSIANIALPAGVYLLIYSLWRRTGIITLCTLPLMILGAFQLVLTYLYGESIIAVDMFLNVVTTNFTEASELLANILIAIIAVIVLYLPLLAWSIYAICRGMSLSSSRRKEMRVWGASAALFGALICVMATLYAPKEESANSFSRNIFPVNVVENMLEAIKRTRLTAHYPETSAQFTFNAHRITPDDSQITENTERAIFVFVVGETSRAINWQLGGYERPTNPRLSSERNLVFFPRAISESNTTHKSVPMLITHLNAENFDSIPRVKSIITAMKEAGFYTRFFSNQAPNHSYTEFFGNEADDVRYADTSVNHYDMELADWVKEAASDSVHPRQFILLHSYGSHFLYFDRYPRSEAYFLPDDALDANSSNRPTLINAYDNTIRYTDAVLYSIITTLNAQHCPAALVYSSDHGEDIFDDNRERFLHASPNPTYYQLHVGMLAWLSDSIAARHPQMLSTLQANADSLVSPQRSLFPTMLTMAGVSSPKADIRYDLTSEAYRSGKPVYLNDLNRSLPLMQSGLKKEDKKLISALIGN